MAIIDGGSRDDVLMGTSANDVMHGFAGHDLIYGGDGDDVLIGGLGADLIDGGVGIDTAAFGSPVTLDLARPGSSTGEAAGDTYVSIERFVGSSGVDRLYGSATADHLSGGGGNDVLAGRNGDDTLLGGDGNDTINGGLGADTIDGGAGTDRVVFSTAVTLDLATPGASTGEAAGDTYVSIERFSGSNAADTLLGDDAGNVFYGNGGNDLLDGRGGNDRFYSGTGTNRIRGGDGIDIADYSGIDAPMLIDLIGWVADGGERWGTASGYWASAYTADLLNGVETAIGSATQSNTMRGANSADTLIGGAAADLFVGRDGNDRIIAGGGADTVLAGGGVDRVTLGADGARDAVRFEPFADYGDIVTGFEVDHDVVELARWGIGLASDAQFGVGITFQVGSVATGGGPVVLWNDAIDRLILDTNGGAAGGTTTIAVLQGVDGLTAANVGFYD